MRAGEDRRSALSRCREVREREGARAVIAFLEVQVGEWTRELVDAAPSEMAGLQGAVRRVRDLLREIRREEPEEGRPDGAYS